MADAVQVALLDEAFDTDRITPLRHAVRHCAAEVGLRAQKLEDFVLAVNEIVTNAVRHAGGIGRLRMWIRNGSVLCEVADGGAGIPVERLNGWQLPPSSAVGGRGLWMARHLCDDVTVRTGPEGTTVTLKSALEQSPGRT